MKYVNNKLGYNKISDVEDMMRSWGWSQEDINNRISQGLNIGNVNNQVSFMTPQAMNANFMPVDTSQVQSPTNSPTPNNMGLVGNWGNMSGMDRIAGVGQVAGALFSMGNEMYRNTQVGNVDMMDMNARSKGDLLTRGNNFALNNGYKNQLGRTNTVTSSLSSAGQGALAGASIAGPLGAAIGGGVGLIGGAISSLFGNNQRKKREEAATRQTIRQFNTTNTKINNDMIGGWQQNQLALGGLLPSTYDINDMLQLRGNNLFAYGGEHKPNKVKQFLRDQIYSRFAPTSYAADQIKEALVRGVPNKRLESPDELRELYSRLKELESKKNRTPKEEEELNILVGKKERISGDYTSVQDEDAYLTYLGMDQIGGSVIDSKYVPIDAKDPNAKYKTLQFREDQINEIKELVDYYEHFGAQYPVRGATLDRTPALENVTLDRGWDDSGEYISIYDRYDMNPVTKGIAGKLLDKAENWIAKPYEVYDRIYLNDHPVPQDFEGYNNRNIYTGEQMYDMDLNYSGIDIKKLQKSINAHNKNDALDIDGSYGPATKKAYEEFKNSYKFKNEATGRQKFGSNQSSRLGFDTEKNTFAYGGLINKLAYGGDFTTGVNRFGSGDSHESNPFGGIPISVDEEGNPNLVEENEVRWEDYIFSDRIKVSGVAEALLPKNLEGMSFADAAMKLSEEMEERPVNTISKRGRDTNLMRLAMLQEQNRPQEETEGNTFALGGQTKGCIPYAFASGFNPNYNTPLNYEANAVLDVTSPIKPKEEVKEMENDFTGIGKQLYEGYIKRGYNPELAKAVTSQDMLESGWGKSPSGNFNYGNLTTGSNWKGSVYEGKDKDADGNTITQKFRSYNNIDEYLDDKVNFLNRLYDVTGADNTDSFIEKISGNNSKLGKAYAQDPDYASKIRSVISGDKNVSSTSAKSASTAKGISDSTSVSSGSTQHNQVSNPTNVNQVTSGEVTPLQQRMMDMNQARFEYERERNAALDARDAEMQEQLLQGVNSNNMMRYAPLFANAGLLGMAFSDSPERLQLGRIAPQMINERLEYTPMDSDYVANQVRQQASATNAMMMDASGGNRGIAQAALLAGNRSAGNSLGEALFKTNEFNAAERERVTGFNRQTSQFNAQQDLYAQQFNTQAFNQEQQYNAQANAALRSMQREGIATLGNTLGAIGTENRWFKIAPVLGGGYNSMGVRGKPEGFAFGGKINKRKIK